MSTVVIWIFITFSNLIKTEKNINQKAKPKTNKQRQTNKNPKPMVYSNKIRKLKQNWQSLSCSQWIGRDWVAHTTLKRLRCLQITSINYVPSSPTTSPCKITSVASQGKEWKNGRMSIKVLTEMPEGRCANVCGLKYTQKKNNSFKGFQQFSFLIYGRKLKGIKEKMSLQ